MRDELEALQREHPSRLSLTYVLTQEMKPLEEFGAGQESRARNAAMVIWQPSSQGRGGGAPEVLSRLPPPAKRNRALDPIMVMVCGESSE